MKAFKYFTPVAIYYGENCVKEHATLFQAAGEKAFIITGKFIEGYQNIALEDVASMLAEIGVTYELCEDVIENPPVESVAEITEKVRAFDADYIIAIGGGSAIDTAKAVSCLLKYPGQDPYDVFFGNWSSYGDKENDCSIPVFSIPTTAGTSADITGGAVLTRADTDTKLAASQFLTSKYSFMDVRYIENAPYFLIDTGAMDTLAHGMETYINVNSNFMNRAVAEIGFKLFAEYKDALLAKTMKREDFEKMLMATAPVGMAFMQAGTALPHGMSYPLSHHKNVNHGLGCAIFLGEYVKAIKDQSIVLPIIQMCGFETVDEFAAYVKEITNRNVHIEVTEEELNAWADEFASLEYRLARHPEPIGRDEIYTIYHDALEAYIK